MSKPFYDLAKKNYPAFWSLAMVDNLHSLGRLTDPEYADVIGDGDHNADPDGDALPEVEDYDRQDDETLPETAGDSRQDDEALPEAEDDTCQDDEALPGAELADPCDGGSDEQ